MYKKTILENKVRVVTSSMPHARSVSCGVWINAGGRFESQSNKGMAHFLEHMVFKGSSKYSGKQIKRSIEGVGGALNGFTSVECTCYLAKIPDGYTKKALDVLVDMTLNPLVDQKELRKEREVILEEIRMYKDLPSAYVHDLLDELLWPTHPLGMPIIGTEESLRGIDAEKMLEFQRQFYSASNLLVAASGKLEHKKIVDYVEKLFEKLKKSDKNSFLGASISQSGPEIKILTKPIEQTHMAIGFHGVSRCDKKRFALSLLHVILGANMSSRLFDEVREKRGYAYSIGTNVKFHSDTGSFLVHAGVHNDKVSDTLKVILNELERIKKEPIDSKEFRRAKDYFIGQLSLSLEDTMDQMLWIGESTIKLDKVFKLEEIVKEVKKIEPHELMDLANSIFKRDSLNLAAIGPFNENQEQEIKGIL